MIVTVTCNPAVDVTHRVGRFEAGEVHRVREVLERPGGKGVNVARVLHQLGEQVTAVGLADPGFAAAVEASGLPARFVPALASVRRTVVVVDDDGRATALWEPGHPAAPGADDDLAAVLAGLLPTCSALVVSGSLPPGVPPGLPARLAALAADAGVPTVLDVEGEALACVAEARCATVLVPNRAELAGFRAGDPAQAAHVLAARSGAAVVATLGPDGAVAVTADGSWWARPPERVAGNPTGAGDAVAAGAARGLVRGLGWPELLADAVALGTAAVRMPTAGEVDVAAYRSWRDRVPVVAAAGVRR